RRGRPRSESSTGKERVAKEGVRDLRIQSRPERQVLRIELVDVDAGVARPAKTQVIASSADVADRNRLVARQLTLQVDRVLLNARRRAVLVDVGDVGAHAGQRAQAVRQ